MNVKHAVMVVLAVVVLGNAASGGILFSYDSSTGQFPTEQGWSAFEIDTTGPLTEASLGGAVSGTAANNANAAIEMVDGVNTLHIRDTLTDSAADLPVFYFPWSTSQQQELIDNGLRFTMVFQPLTNTTNNSNVRFGFNGTEFETQMDNIGADQTVQVLGFGADPFPIDGMFHTLVITGQKNGTNYDFSFTVDGGAATPMSIVANPAPATIQSAVYFGALQSGNRNSDLLVRSVTMESVPEPTVAAMAFLGLLTCMAAHRRVRE
jgi:hypothetical protein